MERLRRVSSCLASGLRPTGSARGCLGTENGSGHGDAGRTGGDFADAGGVGAEGCEQAGGDGGGNGGEQAACGLRIVEQGFAGAVRPADPADGGGAVGGGEAGGLTGCGKGQRAGQGRDRCEVCLLYTSRCV